MATKTIFRTIEGDDVFIAKCTKPAGVEYAEPAWWAFTRGRGPDIEIAGPCLTKAALLRQLRKLAEQGQLVEKRRGTKGEE
jgi:hypothetical protein